MTKLNRAAQMLANVGITKLQDENYVTREMLADMIGDMIGNRPGKKYTRRDLVEALSTMVANQQKNADVTYNTLSDVKEDVTMKKAELVEKLGEYGLYYSANAIKKMTVADLEAELQDAIEMEAEEAEERKAYAEKIAAARAVVANAVKTDVKKAVDAVLTQTVEVTVGDLDITKDSMEVVVEPVKEEVPVLELTKEQKILVAKKVKEACLNTKMRTAGISLCDAQDLICAIVFGKTYYRIHSVKAGVVGTDRMGNEVYDYRKERVSQVSEAENRVIGDTLTRMVHGDCLKPNREGTFFFLTSKLYRWNFAA